MANKAFYEVLKDFSLIWPLNIELHAAFNEISGVLDVLVRIESKSVCFCVSFSSSQKCLLLSFLLFNTYLVFKTKLKFYLFVRPS